MPPVHGVGPGVRGPRPDPGRPPRGSRRRRGCFRQGSVDAVTPALHPSARAGMVDQHAANDLGRECKKMGPALPLNVGDLGDAQVGLVHQGRGLQGVVGSFLSQDYIERGRYSVEVPVFPLVLQDSPDYR